jgi:hypothetical protein
MGMTEEEYRTQTGRFRLELVDDDGGGFWRLIDTATGEEVGTDSGEPEDKTLGRDLRWVVDLANKLAGEIAVKDRRIAELHEALVKVTREAPYAGELDECRAQRASLIAEVGRLRAELSKLERTR